MPHVAVRIASAGLQPRLLVFWVTWCMESRTSGINSNTKGAWVESTVSWRHEFVLDHMHEFICFRNPILKSSIVQPPNPVVR